LTRGSGFAQMPAVSALNESVMGVTQLLERELDPEACPGRMDREDEDAKDEERRPRSGGVCSMEPARLAVRGVATGEEVVGELVAL
jgi:hypothetical protein